MNILVTGVAGSGKTTIAAELTKRGYSAYDMDYIEGLCSWVDLATGKPEPNLKIQSAADWAGQYDWWWNEQHLRQLLKGKNLTFFCGSSGNQDKFYDLFSKAFLLETNEQLIRGRVLNGDRDHGYGRMPGELEVIFGYYKEFQDKAKTAGAIVVDASKPVEEIVGLIIAESLVDA